MSGLRFGLWVSAVLATTWAALLTGCEEDVVGASGLEQPYSIYGLLTPQLDTQWVRVFPIETVLEPETDEPMDAVVVSTDLTTGEQRTWKDSLLTEITGQRSHVFWSPFTAEYEHKYRVTVTRSDGAQSQIDVTVPPKTTIRVDPFIPEWPVRTTINVYGGAPNLIRVSTEFDIRVYPDNDLPRDFVFDIPIEEELIHEGDDWRIPFVLGRSFESVSGLLETLDVIEAADDFAIELRRITLNLRVVNKEWETPEETYDPEILAEPGLLENVENGFGFIGAGYRSQLTWLPSDEVLIAARFRPPEERQFDPSGTSQ